MNKYQSARLNMNNAVLRFLDIHEQTVKQLPDFELVVKKLRGNVGKIRKITLYTKQENEDLLVIRKKLRLELAAETTTLCSHLNTFAIDNGLTELQKKIAANLPDLHKMASGNLLGFARLMHVMLLLHVAELKAYSVTPATVQHLYRKSEQLATAIGGTIITEDFNTTANAELKELMKENIRLYEKKIKPLARMHFPLYPGFFHKLIELCQVRSLTISASRATGVVKDKRTGYPLAGVVIKAEGTSFQATSKRKGYHLPLPEKKTCTLVFEKPGYKSVVVKNVKIRPGETINIDMMLQAIA